MSAQRGVPTPGQPTPGVAGAAVEQKKGEVNELRALLRTVSMEKDTKKKKDVIKKVVAYMTLGIDVSKLFSDMILACNTKDLVIKKMVYLYLCSYAQSNPELTLLAINTLQKDCRDEDPMVRGLALRSLTSLRLISILEYVMAPLKASLTDGSGYVRQAGVIGVLKVYHLAPDTIREGDYVDILYNMMRDKDPQVVINCILALNEILAEEGGIAINQTMVTYLLMRIRDFNDWGQCIVMELVTKYTPESEDELFGIMNLLEPCLKVAHSAVVLAATKAFIVFTTGLPDIQRQVFLRLRTPMLTLMASSSNEISFSVLAHVALIVDRASGVFDDEFKQFFCKLNEPTSVRALKIGVLPKVANPANARDIVSELTEYVQGTDPDLSRQAVKAIGDIAVRVPPASEAVVESLLELIDLESEYVRAETVVAMQDLLRKYPERALNVIPSLHRCLKRMEDPRGKAAVIWMIGEYGQLIDDAPYLIEPLIDNVKDEVDILVRNELLTATVKLFFKRPPEVQKMMGRLFKAFLSDGVPASVRDRALLYYRLIRTDIQEAGRVIGGEKIPVQEFLDEQAQEVKDKIWSEFNTLSVVYGRPSETFISADHLIAAPPPLPENPVAAGVASNDDTALLSGQDDALPSENSAQNGKPSGSAPAGVTSAPVVDLMDDLLGLGGGFIPPPVAPAPLPTFAFQPSPILDAPTYQSKWQTITTSVPVQLRALRPVTAPEIEALTRSNHINTIASGDLGGQLKFFFYARDDAGAYHLFETVYDKASGAISATLKSDNPASLQAASRTFAAALKPITG